MPKREFQSDERNLGDLFPKNVGKENDVAIDNRSVMIKLCGHFLLTIATVLLLDWQVMSHAQNASGRLADRLRELDSDQNGTLSLTESGREKAVFDQMDANKDGQLTVREVGDYLRGGGRLGPTATPTAPPKEIVGEFTASMPVSLRSCRAAADYSRQSKGHAVLIMVDGATVYENYHNGWSVEATHRLASGTKSFAGVVAAVAVGEELFEFDDPVSETITQWKDDPRLSRVTIRQLLSLTSGIDPGDNSVVLPYRQAIQVSCQTPSRDKVRIWSQSLSSIRRVDAAQGAASQSIDAGLSTTKGV